MHVRVTQEVLKCTDTCRDFYLIGLEAGLTLGLLQDPQVIHCAAKLENHMHLLEQATLICHPSSLPRFTKGYPCRWKERLPQMFMFGDRFMGTQPGQQATTHLEG